MPNEPASKAAELSSLFRTHFDFVWRVLRRCGLTEHEADDGVQEVFLVVANQLDQYQERGALRAWLFTIARQVASHARRADARRQKRQAWSDPPAPFPDPQQAAERRQAAAWVERFLESLNEGQSLVFYLSEVEGLSAPEIATALGLELSTVYGRQRMTRQQFASFVQRTIKPGAKP